MARRRSYKRHSWFDKIFWGLAIFYALTHLVGDMCRIPEEKAALYICFFLIASTTIYFFLKFLIRQLVLYRKKMKIKNSGISMDRFDYVVRREDYKRGNNIERRYKKNFTLLLLDIFDNCCAKCSRRMNGIEIDHFFLPKNDGGNFALRHKDSFWVNNAIPLCSSCNRSKSDRTIEQFFNSNEIENILSRSNFLTSELNRIWPNN